MEKKRNGPEASPPRTVPPLHCHSTTPTDDCQEAIGNGPKLNRSDRPPLAVPVPLPVPALEVDPETGEIAPATPSSLSSFKAHIRPALYLTLSPFGRLFQLHGVGPAGTDHVGGQRGIIQAFSRDARKRLMQMFATIDEQALVKDALMVTLTYGARWPAQPAQWQGQFTAFWKRVARRYPDAACIWRLEFQARGAPHYHLLVFGVRFVPKEQLTEMWAEIAHEGEEHAGAYSTHVMGIRDWRQAAYYISKYLAKTDKAPLPGGCGRTWGVRNEAAIPFNVFDVDLTDEEFGTLKAWLRTRIPPGILPEFTWLIPVGCWTMLKGELGGAALAWVKAGGRDVEEFNRQHGLQPESER